MNSWWLWSSNFIFVISNFSRAIAPPPQEEFENAWVIKNGVETIENRWTDVNDSFFFALDVIRFKWLNGDGISLDKSSFVN